MLGIIRKFFLFFGFHRSYGRIWISKRFDKVVWGSFIALSFYNFLTK